MHGWLIDIARTLEASGFDASNNRSVRRKVIREFMEILERYAESNPELRAKMDDPVGSYSLMKQVLEDRMTAEEVEAEGTPGDSHGFISIVYSGPNSQAENVVVVGLSASRFSIEPYRQKCVKVALYCCRKTLGVQYRTSAFRPETIALF